MNSKIYLGEVAHTRLSPVRHAFRYPVYFYAFDLDELPELSRGNPLFGHNKLRPVALHDRDYLLSGEAPIREKLETLLADAGIGFRLGKVVLVTAARFFNYVFNPISFFYCHDTAGALSCVLCQVNNTFGEMHLYLLDPRSADVSKGRMLLRREKEFHVSPFFPRRGLYEFRLSEAGEKIDNLIRYNLDGELVLVARIRGRATPLSGANLLRTIVMHPISAGLTMPRILMQAARLYWQRRLPVFQKPVPSSAMTVRPAPATLADRAGMKIVLNFLARLPSGDLRLETPEGREHLFGSPGSEPSVRMKVREHRFFRRVMAAGDIGFGESFVDGDWTCSDLPALLTMLAANEAVMDDRSITASSFGRLVNLLRHIRRPNTLEGSFRNIREHYDLSNNFYRTLLDPTMTYSCAFFGEKEKSLEEAQVDKLKSIIEKAGISADDHLLEIGCGWGSFAIEAARSTGCRVTGITVSQAQLELARRRVREAGLEDRIEIRLCDYRRIEGRYSRLVSIEMLEAVGHSRLGNFFAACDRALRPGGRAVIQVITIPDRKYRAYRRSSDWIRKHIFPGGHLPSIGAMEEAMKRSSSLTSVHLEQFGFDYARTLDFWRATLTARRDEILHLGFDESFLRKWEYYFSYCQAGFAAGIIDLTVMTLEKPEKC